MDSGVGKYYNESFPDNRFRLLSIEDKELFGAAQVSFNQYSNEPTVLNALEDSCVSDVRFDQEWFPMDTGENGDSDVGEVLQTRNMEDQCLSDACLGFNCPDEMFCFDRWKNAYCK